MNRTRASVGARASVDALGGLDATLAAGGANISAGQRQLFAMARAMLDRRSVLVLDEATANVDYATDAVVQRVLYHPEEMLCKQGDVMNELYILEEGQLIQANSHLTRISRHTPLSDLTPKILA